MDFLHAISGTCADSTLNTRTAQICDNLSQKFHGVKIWSLLELVTERIGLRYWPEKGAEPRIKWLPTEASKLVKDTINELIELTKGAREAAQWLEINPTKLNTTISPDTMLDMPQVAEFVGVKNAVFYCKARKIPIVEASKSCGGYKKWYVILKDQCIYHLIGHPNCHF